LFLLLGFDGTYCPHGLVSASSFLLGFIAARTVRFPLVLGGFAMSSFAILIPKGVL
jgi:hypothetical protein